MLLKMQFLFRAIMLSYIELSVLLTLRLWRRKNCAMILLQYGKDAQPVCPPPPCHLPSQPVRGKAWQGALVQALAHPEDHARDEHVEDANSKLIAFVAVAVKENVHSFKLFFGRCHLFLPRVSGSDNNAWHSKLGEETHNWKYTYIIMQ